MSSKISPENILQHQTLAKLIYGLIFGCSVIFICLVPPPNLILNSPTHVTVFNRSPHLNNFQLLGVELLMCSLSQTKDIQKKCNFTECEPGWLFYVRCAWEELCVNNQLHLSHCKWSLPPIAACSGGLLLSLTFREGRLCKLQLLQTPLPEGFFSSSRPVDF